MKTFVGLFCTTNHSENDHTMLGIENGVNDPPIPDPDPMEVPLKFFYSDGSWVFPQPPKGRVDSRENVAGNFVQLFLSSGVENNFVSHSA